MSSTDTPRGRHRLAVGGTTPGDRRGHSEVRRQVPAPSPRPVRPPALLPRSATVVAAAVGAVIVMGVQERVDVPASRPHPDAPVAAFEPVVPAPRDGRPARIDPVPAGVTGAAIAGAHTTGSASVGALDAVAATQPSGGVAPEHLFAA